MTHDHYVASSVVKQTPGHTDVRVSHGPLIMDSTSSLCVGVCGWNKIHCGPRTRHCAAVVIRDTTVFCFFKIDRFVQQTTRPTIYISWRLLMSCATTNRVLPVGGFRNGWFEIYLAVSVTVVLNRDSRRFATEPLCSRHCMHVTAYDRNMSTWFSVSRNGKMTDINPIYRA